MVVWDLPKGKLEPAEDFKTAALREVQEECGLDNQLYISKLLHVSFHTYIQNSKSILKRTHWYKMNYYGQNKLKPQKKKGLKKFNGLLLKIQVIKLKFIWFCFRCLESFFFS